MAEFQVRPLDIGDKDWISRLITERWGAEFMIVHGKTYYPRDLPGFVALKNTDKVGLVTYVITKKECEIVTLDSLEPSVGIGTALIDAVKDVGRESGCKRVCLTTTNDNLNALRFYQKRGFVLVTIRRDVIKIARQYKPIPLIGANGIPIRDEIELEVTI